MRFLSIAVMLSFQMLQLVVKTSSTITFALRKLQKEISFLSYEPTENVDAYAAIDLDQRSIIARTSLETEVGMDQAKQIYTKGSFSQSYASLKVNSVGGGLSTEILAGSDVSGIAYGDGSRVGGFIMKNAKVENTELMVQYDVGTNCFVGGNPNPEKSGCFAKSGTIVVDGQSITYTYNLLGDTFNSQSIQRLNMSQKTAVSTAYSDYSGTYDYNNQWILAALNGASTRFPNSMVDFDFGNFGLEGRAASVRWGTVGMNVWGYVSSKLEEAAESCNDDQALRDWDQAVAVYTGSMAKTEGNTGYLLYTLAQVECNNFGTCIKDKNDIADVNSKVFENFVLGKGHVTKNECANAKKSVKRIQALMKVPLIQQVLRMTYALDNNDDYQETVQGQAAAFAASILPSLHKCKDASAISVYNDLAPGKGPSASYEVIKFALERTYDCLEITCADVGGLLDTDPAGTKYLKGAEPCDYIKSPVLSPASSPSTPSTDSVLLPSKNNLDSSVSKNGFIIGIAIGITALVATVLFITVAKHKREIEFATDNSAGGIHKTSDLDLVEVSENQVPEII